MKSISTFRFVLWALVVSAGWFALMLQHTFAASLLLGCSGVLLVSRRELSRPVPLKDLFYIFGVLGALIACVFVVSRLWPDPKFVPVISHPALIVPLWTITLGLGYWRWRHERQTQNAV